MKLTREVPMLETPKIAYNVEVIHDCIVRDTEIYRKFNSKPKKLALFREKKRLLKRPVCVLVHARDIIFCQVVLRFLQNQKKQERSLTVRIFSLQCSQNIFLKKQASRDGIMYLC